MEIRIRKMITKTKKRIRVKRRKGTTMKETIEQNGRNKRGVEGNQGKEEKGHMIGGRKRGMGTNKNTERGAKGGGERREKGTKTKINTGEKQEVNVTFSKLPKNNHE